MTLLLIMFRVANERYNICSERLKTFPRLLDDGMGGFFGLLAAEGSIFSPSVSSSFFTAPHLFSQLQLQEHQNSSLAWHLSTAVCIHTHVKLTWQGLHPLEHTLGVNTDTPRLSLASSLALISSQTRCCSLLPLLRHTHRHLRENNTHTHTHSQEWVKCICVCYLESLKLTCMCVSSCCCQSNWLGGGGKGEGGISAIPQQSIWEIFTSLFKTSVTPQGRDCGERERV